MSLRAGAAALPSFDSSSEINEPPKAETAHRKMSSELKVQVDAIGRVPDPPLSRPSRLNTNAD